MNYSLYEGNLIRLTAPEPDQDAETESRWTHDTIYLRLLSTEPARPLAPAQVKRRHEARQKEVGGKYYFAVRTRADNRLIGFVRLYHIEWNNGTAELAIGIGDPADRRQGYGADALRLILRYAFDELNLHRLSVSVPEYNQAALRFFEQAGFVPEVRRRQAIHRDGRRWDLLMLGLLHTACGAMRETQDMKEMSDEHSAMAR